MIELTKIEKYFQNSKKMKVIKTRRKKNMTELKRVENG
jgi:hypothetical protein